MNMFDEARAIQSTMELCKMTQSELATQLGVSQSYIANKLRLLTLSPRLCEEIIEYGLSERHARALLRLDDEDKQERILFEVAQRHLTVRECECMVDAALVPDIPLRISRAGGLDRIGELCRAIKGAVEVLCAIGVEARSKTDYLDGNMYITVCIKDA